MAQQHDSRAWQETLAAAQRVMGYYASKAERLARQHSDSNTVPTPWGELEPPSRLAA